MATKTKRPTLAELRKEARRCGYDVFAVSGDSARVMAANGHGSHAEFKGPQRMEMALAMLRALPDWRKP